MASQNCNSASKRAVHFHVPALIEDRLTAHLNLEPGSIHDDRYRPDNGRSASDYVT